LILLLFHASGLEECQKQDKTTTSGSVRAPITAALRDLYGQVGFLTWELSIRLQIPSSTLAFRPRRREQAEATRKAILDAAQRLFERQGYSATSIPSIAEEAGVALKTIYVYLDTKAALVHTLWDARLGGEEAKVPVLERD
jgi:hypothetical protein